MASLQKLSQKQRFDRKEARILRRRIARYVPFFGVGTEPGWTKRAGEWISPQLASAAAYFDAKHSLKEVSA
jgi:hypothetical protein